MAKSFTSFNHKVDAYKNKKISKLIDRFGIIGYGYYWIIIEMCVSRINGAAPVDGFLIPKSDILFALRVKQKTLQEFLDFANSISLLKSFHSGNEIRITIPNLPRYLRFRNNKPVRRCLMSALSNIDKVPQSNQKPVSESAMPSRHDAICQLFREVFKHEIEKGVILSPPFFSRKVYDDLNITDGFFKSLDDWRALFETCRSSDFLMGKIRQSGRGFKFTFSWIVVAENAQKVLEGKYTADKSLESTSYMESIKKMLENV